MFSFKDFWIGARDLQTLEQFVWDHHSPITPNILPFFPFPTVQTCLRYRITSAKSQSFHSHSGGSYYYFLMPNKLTTK